MEELQDALEDAQYVNAINVDEGPRPITAWENPSEEALSEWKQLLIQKWEKDPEKLNKLKPLEFEWVLSKALGLFLFSSYVKEVGTHVQMCFIEEMLRWRCLRGRSRGLKLRKIYERYLMPTPSSIDEETKEITKKIPQKTLIDELDMAYTRHGPKLNEETLNGLMAQNIDETCSKCCIGINGPLRDNTISPIVQSLQSVHKDGETSVSGLSVERLHHMPDFSSVKDSSAMKVSDNVTEQTQGETQNETPDETPESQDETPESPDETPESPEVPEVREEPKKRVCSRSIALSKIPDNLFDEIEQVILEDLRRKWWPSFAKKGVPNWDKLLNLLWHESQPVVEEDFFPMRVLGRGGFGLVTASKKGTTGKLYAMKVMNKRRIKNKKSSTLALNELAVLKVVDSPFVVNLKYSFQTKDDLYLILDLMTGGDLSFHLSQKRRFSKDQCLYYAARIMLGLQALHDQHYVYRDLKPENLLLAEDGRVRITDLGLATTVTSRLHGAAGTRGYWAPEMLKRNAKGKRLNYDHRVDWFSYGCVLAEMISGVNPFRSEAALKFGQEHETTKEKAIDYATIHMEPSLCDKYFNETASDLVLLLLNKNPDKRLGTNGCEEIMTHPWFKTVKWEKIISDTEEPPFVPLKDINAASQSEIGTFAEDRNAPKLDEKDAETYKNWNWTNPKVFSAEVLEMLIYERDTGRPLIPLTAGGSCCCTVM